MKEIVEAGAGCGKTYGLVTRYLAALGIRRGDAVPPGRYRATMPSKILTLTFTNDAADEMRARIIAALREAGREDLAGQVEEQGRISTFHSFCYKILKPHLTELGYADSEILSEVESHAHKVSHILKVLAESPLSEDVQRLYELRKVASFCSSNWRRPSREIEQEIAQTYSEVTARTQEWLSETLAMIESAAAARPEFLENPDAWPYQSYEALKDGNWGALATISFAKNHKKWWAQEFPEVKLRAETLRNFAQKKLYRYLEPQVYEQEIRSFGLLFEFLESVQAYAPRLLDFDALEFETLAFLRAKPEKTPKYELIIVDEFQDTNKRQVEILDSIGSPETELYYVGDPKQAIYSFRGGDVRVFEAQKLLLENASLEINRRSLPPVLNFMNELTRRTFVDAEDPIAQELKPCDEKISLAEHLPSNVVVTRVPDKKSSAFWDAVAQDLLEAALQPESTHAVLCQKWSTAFEAFEQLQRRGVRATLGNDLDMGRHHLSALWIAYLKTLDANVQAVEHWNHLASAWSLTVIDTAKIAAAMATEQDPRAWLRSFVNLVNPRRWPQGILWLASLETWIQNHGAQLRWVPSAPELASSFQKSMNLRLNLEAPKNPLTELGAEGEARVTITTIHKSKGLQYQNVYLFDLFEGQRRGTSFSVTDADEDESLESFKIRSADGELIPSLYYKKKKAADEQKTLAEKKRLFYVAYTRAESNLYFYVSGDTSVHKASTPSLESQVWQWPSAVGLSWDGVVQNVVANLPETYVQTRDLATDASVAIAEVVTGVDEWSLPAPREASPLSTERAFLRTGARTYIDTVLFADQKTPFETFGAAAGSPGAAPRTVDPAHWLNVGSSLHKILEKWDGRTCDIDAWLEPFHEVQRPHLRHAMASLASFADLQPLWQDAQQHPERVQREVGVFVHDESYRISGFADLIWFCSPDKAIILDWKSSSSARAAFDPVKIAKTEAQVSLYAKSLKPMIREIEVWSLAVIFHPKIELQWLFRKMYVPG